MRVFSGVLSRVAGLKTQKPFADTVHQQNVAKRPILGATGGPITCQSASSNRGGPCFPSMCCQRPPRSKSIHLSRSDFG
jgi:hypothetical protein